ncbi:MAG: hypothetical protein AAFN70_18355, partial [Planctomycetota bacterium]
MSDPDSATAVMDGAASGVDVELEFGVPSTIDDALDRSISTPLGVVCPLTIEQLDPPINHRHQATADESPSDVQRASVGHSSFAGNLRGIATVSRTAFPLWMVDCAAITFTMMMATGLAALVSGTRGLTLLPAQTACVCGVFTMLGLIAGLYPGTGVSPVVEL